MNIRFLRLTWAIKMITYVQSETDFYPPILAMAMARQEIGKLETIDTTFESPNMRLLESEIRLGYGIVMKDAMPS